jgi:hypothetical protein
MQEIMKLRSENNQTETKNQQKQKLFFFLEKINKIDKPLSKLTKGPRGNIQINKIRNGKRHITTEPEEIQEIIRSYYKSLHSTKLENLDELKKLSTQIPGAKLKSGSDKPSKQSHHP